MQITINTRTQEKINELTDTVNNLVRNTKPEHMNTENLYESLISRNRIELETLMLSVTLTKIGIINPAILDSNDLEKIVNEHFTNITVTDLLLNLGSIPN